jgi:hypothetical protein
MKLIHPNPRAISPAGQELRTWQPWPRSSLLAKLLPDKRWPLLEMVGVMSSQAPEPGFFSVQGISGARARSLAPSHLLSLCQGHALQRCSGTLLGFRIDKKLEQG